MSVPDRCYLKAGQWSLRIPLDVFRSNRVFVLLSFEYFLYERHQELSSLDACSYCHKGLASIRRRRTKRCSQKYPVFGDVCFGSLTDKRSRPIIKICPLFPKSGQTCGRGIFRNLPFCESNYHARSRLCQFKI
jgi:hypothetical protein